MKEDCFGYHNGECTILTINDCTGCKFYATRTQAAIDRMKAARSLEIRGLEPTIKKTDEGMIMSVRKK